MLVGGTPHWSSGGKVEISNGNTGIAGLRTLGGIVDRKILLFCDRRERPQQQHVRGNEDFSTTFSTTPTAAIVAGTTGASHSY